MLRIIVGLGATGLSCVRYFSRQQHPIAVVDTREHPPALAELQANFPEVPVILGELNPRVLSQASELILSPGIALQHPVIAACLAQGIPVLGDIELFARGAKAPIIAITGSNAKSTVTTLVGLMAQQAGKHALVGGNIGKPVLDLLEQPTPDVYILELSSFQLETISSLACVAATILNLSEDHMDRYSSLTDYHVTKQRIYQGAKVAVWNRDDILTCPADATTLKAVTFGLDEPSEQEFGLALYQQQYWLAKGNQRLLPVTELRIKGKHNWANALAALALGEQLGLPWDAMLQTLRTFAGLPHRCQWVATKNEVQWYNDSKGTNVGSTIAAINGFGVEGQANLILIAGGDGKGASFTELIAPVAAYVRMAILIGQDAKRLGATLASATQVSYASDLLTAVALAATVAEPGDRVLLSPACASLDMFKDYQHRGEVFINAVKEL